MRPSEDGMLLMESSLKRIYSNAEATQILAYPEDPESVKSLEKLLAEKVGSALQRRDLGDQASFVIEFRSGKRRYLCRAFRLHPRPNDPDQRPSIALLMERCPRPIFDGSELAKQFRLTRREQETIEYLMQGLTSKEIADRMVISPNTVKAFLRLIMFKMGVSTRSGIIGKIFETRS
jgi:DNA-binding CsgD family transcriptional regulator